MLLQEPQLSAYDLQFSLLGIPVRVSWGFWILGAVLGWQQSQVMDMIYLQLGWETPGAFPLLLVFIAGLFISILVHELGHSLMHRYYGMDSRIVLYHFGGLAIPGSFTAWNAARRRFTNNPKHLIAISAAGPAAQMLLAFVVWVLATAIHLDVGVNHYIEWLTGLELPAVELSTMAAVTMFLDVLVIQSVFWAVLNLLPVLPLDGGNIMRELLRLFGNRNPMATAAMVSMAMCGVLCVWAFQTGRQGAGLMCMSLLASNFQLYQSSRWGY